MTASPELDTEVRAKTFAQVAALRERFADRIPRVELARGITIAGQRVPIWNYQKGIFKPAILGRDGAALSIHTSADSPYSDVHDAEAGHFIYKYRGTNPVHPDNHALRNAMLTQRPLLYLLAVDPGYYDAIMPVYVVGDEPDRLQFALMADQFSALQGDEPPLTELRRAYTTRAVMERVHQQQFRRRVLRAYRDQCAICRLRHLELLDAAHILPDRHPLGEPLISNGLGLCKIHHGAYDSRILGIDGDYLVHVRGDVLREEDGPMLRYGLQRTHGTQLVLPRRLESQPNRDWLAERFEQFRAA